MNFREATLEDIELMASLSVNQDTERKIGEPLDFVYTLEHKGELLVVGGFRMIVPTTAWCWLDLSEYGVKHIRDSFRTIKEWGGKWAKANGVKRLQCFTRDQEDKKRLVTHCGFKQESIMKNFYGDEDAILFARVF